MFMKLHFKYIDVGGKYNFTVNYFLFAYSARDRGLLTRSKDANTFGGVGNHEFVEFVFLNLPQSKSII